MRRALLITSLIIISIISFGAGQLSASSVREIFYTFLGLDYEVSGSNLTVKLYDFEAFIVTSASQSQSLAALASCLLTQSLSQSQQLGLAQFSYSLLPSASESQQLAATTSAMIRIEVNGTQVYPEVTPSNITVTFQYTISQGRYEKRGNETEFSATLQENVYRKRGESREFVVILMTWSPEDYEAELEEETKYMLSQQLITPSYVYNGTKFTVSISIYNQYSTARQYKLYVYVNGTLEEVVESTVASHSTDVVNVELMAPTSPNTKMNVTSVLYGYSELQGQYVLEDTETKVIDVVERSYAAKSWSDVISIINNVWLRLGIPAPLSSLPGSTLFALAIALFVFLAIATAKSKVAALFVFVLAVMFFTFTGFIPLSWTFLSVTLILTILFALIVKERGEEE